MRSNESTGTSRRRSGFKVADYSVFSERVGSFLRSGRPELHVILREDAAGLDALVEIFSRVCAAMAIDARDESALQTVRMR